MILNPCYTVRILKLKSHYHRFTSIHIINETSPKSQVQNLELTIVPWALTAYQYQHLNYDRNPFGLIGEISRDNRT